MAQKSFDCTVVTPTASLISGKVTQAVVPLWDGSMGFLAGRGPILARLGAGELSLNFADTTKGKGGQASFYVEGGFAKMSDDKLTVLAERAMPVEDLDASKAETELKAAATVAVPGGTKLAQADARREAADRARAKARVAGRARK